MIQLENQSRVCSFQQGMNLNAGSDERDVKVYIGVEECVVQRLNSDSVICLPPKDQPAAGNFYGNDTEAALPVVTVSHYNDLHSHSLL